MWDTRPDVGYQILNPRLYVMVVVTFYVSSAPLWAKCPLAWGSDGGGSYGAGTWSTFSISLTLTKEGAAHVDELVEMVFAYLQVCDLPLHIRYHIPMSSIFLFLFSHPIISSFQSSHRKQLFHCFLNFFPLFFFCAVLFEEPSWNFKAHRKPSVALCGDALPDLSPRFILIFRKPPSSMIMQRPQRFGLFCYFARSPII